MRAIENGLPMIRTANNGVSAIIEPLGRVVQKLALNKVGIIDGYIPLKLSTPTTYSILGETSVILSIIFVLILQLLVAACIRKFLILRNCLR
jgi:apolipoprotein N-acyltransferase